MKRTSNLKNHTCRDGWRSRDRARCAIRWTVAFGLALAICSGLSWAQRIIVLDGDSSTGSDTVGMRGETCGGIIVHDHGGDSLKVSISHSKAGDRVSMGSDVHVGEGEVVRGDAVSVMGDLYVDGLVTGDAVSVGGDVHVGPRGVIRGQAVAVGGRVNEASGSQVGERTQVTFLPRIGTAPRFLVGGGWVAFFTHLLFIGLAGWILLKIWPPRWLAALATIKNRVGGSLLAGLGIGIVYWILIAPLLLVMALILLITILGIPLVPVVLLLMVLLPVPGYTATAALIGAYLRGTADSLERGRDTAWLGSAYLYGHGFLALPWLLAVLLRSITGAWFGAAGVILLLAWGIITLAVAFGWGALLLSRFGRRFPNEAVIYAQPLQPEDSGPVSS